MTPKRIRPGRWVAAAAAILCGATALAQPGAAPQPVERSAWWNTDYMLELYVKGLTRQYNLTPTQEEFTRKLLTKRVKEFLKVHETEMRRLIWEMAEYHQKRQLPDAETAREWAKSGSPVFREARKAILDGNKEWREILDDEQKKRHDQDLRGLEDYFKVMEERLDRWSKGDVNQRDFEPYGRRNPQISPEPWTHAKPEDAWEIYLRGFVRRFNLTDAQREAGESVLRECRRRATEYRDKRKADFDAIDARMAELQEQRKSSSDDKEKLTALSKEIDQLRAKKFDLERPIFEEIGKEFRQRLDGIPTTEQRAAYAEKQKQQLEALQNRPGVRKATVEGRPSTQPADAASQPATP